MTSDRPVGVRVPIALRLVVPEEAAINVRATLEYSPTDPFAIRVLFRTGTGPGGRPDPNDVSWSFSRELLTEGLYRQTGMGDVKVWPWAGRGRHALGLALSSPDGYALFEVPRAPVEDFLARTYSLVPAGSEAHMLDMEHALATFLRTPDADAR